MVEKLSLFRSYLDHCIFSKKRNFFLVLMLTFLLLLEYSF
uniref:Uncharacterized protein n=1 Tax=Brugia timori TaxID=42155 RepID=A0A0R3QZ05_9BILA